MAKPHRRRPAFLARRRLTSFRSVATLLLVLGTAGGGYLGIHQHRQDQLAAEEAKVSADAQIATLDQNKLYEGEASRDPQVQLAEEKAAALAAAAEAKAKKAEELARRTESASRSGTRPSPTPTPTPSSSSSGSSGSSGTVDYGPVPASCKEYSGNRQIGCTLMIEWGFALKQMPCLDKLWTKESGWRTTAENASSGAYGIPQALPATKLAKYGSDYRTNPVPQIKWGLDYVEGRYDTPCGAWSFWSSHNWY